MYITRLARLCLLTVLLRCCVSQPLLNLSLPNYVDIYKPISYCVIGQQKSGTSSLWNNLVVHPSIKWVGLGKELFYFNGEMPRFGQCDNYLEEYQRQAAQQRLLAAKRVLDAGGSEAAAAEAAASVLIGDWSATHFSCMCCPVVFKTLNPDIKLIVVLRDPVQRVLSRFLEQKRSQHLPLYRVVSNHTFASYVASELAELEGCLARAAPLTRPRPPGDTSLRGWGAGMGLGDWMAAQCFARNNILGWSAYSVFMENYLAHFPKEQLLVLYTENLAKEALHTFRTVEAFLGVPPHKYDAVRSNLVFNSRECYHWKCTRPASEIRPLAAFKSDGVGDDGPFAATVARLVAFYRPHMQRLFGWADEGRIAAVPDSWRSTYA